MANEPERIVIDANIFVSFLISDTFHKLEKHLLKNEVRLLFSKELLDELIEVISRPKLKKYFPGKDVIKLIGGLQIMLILLK